MIGSMGFWMLSSTMAFAAEPAELTLGMGAMTFQGAPMATVELDIRPLSVLSFASSGGVGFLTGDPFGNVHQAIRLHPSKNRAVDPYLGLTGAVWPGIYDAPLFVTPGAQLGFQSRLGDHWGLSIDAEVIAWTYQGSDTSVAGVGRFRVGYTF